MNTSTDGATGDPIGDAVWMNRRGHWREAEAALAELARGADRDEVRARAQLALVDGWNLEDWKRGLRGRRDKHALLDEVEAVAERRDEDALRAEATYQRGMALHQEFIMSSGDPDRELASFEHAAALYAALGDREGEAMATAMWGIFHHVDRLDRETALPILRRAYELAPDDGRSYARSEAARHLGQIRQERGEPAAALPMLEESLALRERSGYEIFVSTGVHAVASAKLDSGDLEGAAADLARARSEAERYDGALTLALIATTEAALQMRRLAPGVWERPHP